MTQDPPAYSNDLIHESSPYLLQHAHNPVAWHPWSGESLQKARDLNRPLIVSIGYAACHWCHVMERESFVDPAIAEIMNHGFFCIKVDREERPDVDHVYMDAVQRMTGQGGWPLNCFALPDGRPFFGGTYFKKEDWKSLLKQITGLWTSDPQKIHQAAAHLTEDLQAALDEKGSSAESILSPALIRGLLVPWKRFFDRENGGTGVAPKFPMPNSLEFLLDAFERFGDKEAMDQAVLTLGKMAQGGIWDHLGGGFSRYSVDNQWKVPHFEKMLYDNAQLIGVYARAGQLTGSFQWIQVARDTIGFLDRDLRNPLGGYFASLDADSEGEEGRYYTWRKIETDLLLGVDGPLFSEYYRITEVGNWEGTNVLNTHGNVGFLCRKFNLPEGEIHQKLARSRQILFQARLGRVKPDLDTKIISSWNGLLLENLCKAARYGLNTEALPVAIDLALFLAENRVLPNGQVIRVKGGDQPPVPGFLDDYANLAMGFIALYQLTFGEDHLVVAKRILEFVCAGFQRTAGGLFSYKSKHDTPLFLTTVEKLDQVMPASNSQLAKALFLAGRFFSREDWVEMAREMTGSVLETESQMGLYLSNWGQLACWLTTPSRELTISGPEAKVWAAEISAITSPDFLVAASVGPSVLPLFDGRSEGWTTGVLCVDRTCGLPLETLPALKAAILALGK